MIKLYYGHALIFLALMLGGGTFQSLYTDHLIQLASIPALFMGYACIARMERVVSLFLLTIGLVLLVQFLPVGLVFDGGADTSLFLAKDAGRALESAVFAATGIGLFGFFASFSQADRIALLRMFFVALFVHTLIALVLYSFPSRMQVTTWLPYVVTSGLFTNDNHFALFVCMMIPMAALMLGPRSGGLAMLVIYCALSLFIITATGARAIVIISVGTVLALFARRIIGSWSRVVTGSALSAVFLIIGSLVTGYWRTLVDMILEENRIAIYKPTLEALAEILPKGTGLGSFVLVFPQFEPLVSIGPQFVNHVHNDYAELLLELGPFALILFAWFFPTLTQRAWTKQANPLFVLALCCALAHSFVDYPLRTFAIATTFAFMSSFVFAPPERPMRRNSTSND